MRIEISALHVLFLLPVIVTLFPYTTLFRSNILKLQNQKDSVLNNQNFLLFLLLLIRNQLRKRTKNHLRKMSYFRRTRHEKKHKIILPGSPADHDGLRYTRRR